MKSFLLNKENKPIVKWSMVPNETYFEGEVPEGYALAACPSDNIVILDVDVKNGKCGFNHIPDYNNFIKFIFKIFKIKKQSIFDELNGTFNYKTKSGGAHYWVKYTGNKELLNTSTKYGLDLRIGAKPGNNGGYVKYNHNVDIRECKHLIKSSSEQLNEWLESLFLAVNYGK